MKGRWFVLTAILAMAAVTVFLTNQVTQAQRPDRGGMRDKAEGARRGGPSGTRGMNLISIVDNSWTDLTFSLKVDDDILIKARPVYQQHRDNLETTLKEAHKSEDSRRGLREAVMEIRDGFKTDLKSILTEEQIAKLDTLEKKRMQQMRGRGGARRSGGGNRGR